MLIIKHRWHDLNCATFHEYCDGAEIDIRIHHGELILQHDPFEPGITLDSWLEDFNKPFLIANVKEEGLVPFLKKKLERTNINQYFVLDESIPFIIKHSKCGFQDFGLRVSIWEPVDAAVKMLTVLQNPPRWIWLDTFDGRLPVRQEDIIKLKELGANICLVSPEVHPNYNFEGVNSEFLEGINAIGMEHFNAVCTKIPNFWKEQELH